MVDELGSPSSDRDGVKVRGRTEFESNFSISHPLGHRSQRHITVLSIFPLNLKIFSEPHAVPQSESPSVKKCTANRLETARFPRVDGDWKVLGSKVVKCGAVPPRQESRLGTGNVESDNALVTMTNSKFRDLQRPTFVTHGRHNLPNTAVVTVVPRGTNALLKPFLHRHDSPVKRKPALRVLFRTPPDLAVDDAVRRQILHELPRNSGQPVLRLHDGRRPLKRCEVFHKRTGTSLLHKPVTERHRIRCGQFEVNLIREIDNRLWTHTTIRAVLLAEGHGSTILAPSSPLPRARSVAPWS